ncbi:MAG: lysoplasmalogenase [Sphingobacteriales bacterium]|nr:lysoplasmalogenase [Sphingobacteriales bacterium]
MNKNIWILIFIAALSVYTGGVVQLPDQTMLQYFSKPLLMPLLMIFFLTSVNRITTNLKNWIIAALFFSWAGDILLMFEPKDKIFFMLGLASFLIAHIFYIVFFHHVRIKENVKANPWVMVIIVVYYGALIALLSPYLGDLKWPVRVYGIVISFMFMLAMHMLFIKSKEAGRLMMIGALLFVISDSVLAINKFYRPFEWAGVIIITTYALAQLLIVRGAVKYIRNN